jgi:hypothetical protein
MVYRRRQGRPVVGKLHDTCTRTFGDGIALGEATKHFLAWDIWNTVSTLATEHVGPANRRHSQSTTDGDRRCGRPSASIMVCPNLTKKPGNQTVYSMSTEYLALG